MSIINLDDCIYSDRHGLYGGAAGNKDGIILNGERWIVKYPKTTKSMKGDLASYTTSPLSEYIGSHIYEAIGIPVHETILGIRQGKVVVACKDFRKTGYELAEIRTIKNAANKEMQETLGEEFSTSTTGNRADLEEVLFHIDHNPVLKDVVGVKERFWSMVVVDSIINNNDRNNGNWGILISPEGEKSLAPVYDNGNSFQNKFTFEHIKETLNSPSFKRTQRNIVSSFDINGKPIFVKQLLAMPYEDLKNAIENIIPKIEDAKPNIHKMIDEIPENVGPYTVCTPEYKKYCKEAIEARLSVAVDRGEIDPF